MTEETLFDLLLKIPEAERAALLDHGDALDVIYDSFLIGVPLSILAAISGSAYSDGWLRKILAFMAGIVVPSIIYALIYWTGGFLEGKGRSELLLNSLIGLIVLVSAIPAFFIPFALRGQHKHPAQ